MLLGRARDLERLEARLCAAVCVVTVSGTAGIGKTALVRAFASSRRVHAFCDLGATRSLDDVCTTVARMLGVPLSSSHGTESAVRQIGDALRARSSDDAAGGLLVLDGFEHLVSSSSAAVAAWAERAPGVRIVVTSREWLGIATSTWFGRSRTCTTTASASKPGSAASSSTRRTPVKRPLPRTTRRGRFAKATRSSSSAPVVEPGPGARADSRGRHAARGAPARPAALPRGRRARLRTPIASLTLALEQSADASIEPAVVELLTGALGDAVYLAGLTNNLRLASELREGWDPIAGAASVDLTETVQRVASRASILARRPGIALECSVPDIALRTECNAVAAEQAIGNVVDNAVLHGEPGGHIAVLLEPDGPAGHAGFALSVVDDGPGVPPTELPRLRERTFRSDEARQRDPRGSGLGLAITNEVCVRCGWDLAFSAEMPRGLRVRITGRCS